MPLAHNPNAGKSSAQGLSLINKVLSVAYTDGSNALSYTEPTYFDLRLDGYGAISILEVDGAGAVVSPANNFQLQLMRSMDNGESWQLYKTYSAVGESVELLAVESLLWQFRLGTKGTNNVRVRMRTV